MYKEDVIVFDVDGVLLNTEYIFKEIFNLKLKGDAKWDYFIKHCNSDRTQSYKNILDLWFCLSSRYKIFISTARNEKCKKDTLYKLAKCCFFTTEDNLLMRKSNDYRPATEVKKEHLLQIMKNFNIILFIDDDLANCEMAKELGILTLRKV